MNSFFLVNSTFLPTDIMLKNVEGIAVNLDILFTKEEHKGYIDTQYCDKTGDFYFEIAFYDEGHFLSAKQSGNIRNGHGIIGAVDFDFEDPSLFQFLKKLFDKYPEMLIYYEEGHATYETPFIYSKTDLNKNNSLIMLTRAPGA